jgi:hypothetical protein
MSEVNANAKLHPKMHAGLNVKAEIDFVDGTA